MIVHLTRLVAPHELPARRRPDRGRGLDVEQALACHPTGERAPQPGQYRLGEGRIGKDDVEGPRVTLEEAEGLLMLIERFGYTHEEVAKKIGKSRSSVTEALSIAHLPGDVKDECRRADIGSKSLLLQVVRQPDADAMKGFLKRIVEQGFNRDEARQARTQGIKKARPTPYVFRYTHPSREFVVEVKFKRSAVSREELQSAIAESLSQLDSGG